MKKKILSVLLSFTLIFSTTGFAFADTDLDNPPAKPDKPKVETYKDNDKAKEYNKEAKEYNKDVDKYNAAVDKEYSQAVKDTNQKNAEGQAKQEASQKAHDDAVAANEAEQARVDSENAKIDEQNAAGAASASSHNASEDVKVEQNKKDRETAEAENAARKEAYDTDVAAAEKEYQEAIAAEEERYNAAKEQYDKDYEQYQTDKANADKIAEKYNGMTVEEYNNIIEEKYNKPADKAIEKNKSAEKKEVSDTYVIEEASERSGKTVTVNVKHYFDGTDEYYEENIEIDENDTITFKSVSSIVEQTTPGWASFYYNTDESHVQGYWIGAGSQCLENAKVFEYGWESGETYTISYKDGTNHPGDITDIDVEYHYMWVTLPKGRLYNIPVEPTLPTKNIIEKRIVEEPEYVDVPEIYNPSYETYTPIEHISPIFVDVPDVETWVNLPDPVKREYLKHVSLLGLLPVPTKTNTPSAPAPRTSETTIIFTDNTPTENNPTTTDIKNTNTPLMNRAFAPTGEWALINLIAVLLTFLIAIILIISLAINKIREANDDKEYNNKAIKRILTIIASIISGIVFLLTEDITLPMVLVDKWTIVMIVILLINIIIAILSRRKEKENEEEE